MPAQTVVAILVYLVLVAWFLWPVIIELKPENTEHFFIKWLAVGFVVALAIAPVFWWGCVNEI